MTPAGHGRGISPCLNEHDVAYTARGVNERKVAQPLTLRLRARSLMRSRSGFEGWDKG
jgi:hypothetical protein